MTPFDPWALLAMLLAFYPQPSAEAFARARSERPEYFAGGVIVSTGRDKLRLPDGRVFDFIQNVDGLPSQRRWIVLDVTDAAGTPGDGLQLDPGPLTPLDDQAPIFPASRETFEALVAGQLEVLDGAAGVLDRAETAIASSDLGAAVDRSFAARVTPAAEAHAAIRAALDIDDPIDELVAASEHSGKPGTAKGQYAEPAPPDVDEPDPGTPPGDDEDTPPGTRHPKDEEL